MIIISGSDVTFCYFSSFFINFCVIIFLISYYLNINKNKSKDFELVFNSDLLKEILSCNKDAEGAKMFVNVEGLIKLEFKTNKTTILRRKTTFNLFNLLEIRKPRSPKHQTTLH